MLAPTPPSSRRESGRSEIACAVSALFIVFVAYETQDELLALTGMASFLSHLVPIRLFHSLDLLLTICLGLREQIPIVLAILFGVNFAFRETKPVRTWVHVVWHLAVGTYFYLYIFA